MKVHALLAVTKSNLPELEKKLTELHRQAEKPENYYGFTKTYSPKEEGGEEFPPEKKKVVLRSSDVLRELAGITTSATNLIAKRDFSNLQAVADVTVDGATLISGAPVTFLLALETRITNLMTFVSKMPTLDDGEDWERDEAQGNFKTKPSLTNRTAKLQQPIVLYDATPEHPAQTQLITKDVIAGTWAQVKQSGAFTREEKTALLGKIRKLSDAVKIARETANNVDTTDTNAGNVISDYLFN